MSLIERAKNIMMAPKSEWEVISSESETPMSLLQKYVAPLLLLGAVASFIGYGLVGVNVILLQIKGVKWGMWFALRYLVSGVLSYFVATYVIDYLAGNFASEKDLGRSAQLVAYASTPSWIAGLFMVLPMLSFVSIIGLYGVYLFYIGLPVMKKTPDDKRVGYMIVSALVIIAVSFVAGLAMTAVLNPLLGDPYGNSLQDIRDVFKK